MLIKGRATPPKVIPAFARIAVFLENIVLDS
jgi:hypothetical protein